MRIGIDIRILERNKAGFERYLRHLLENLAKIDEKNEYVLYSDHHIDKEYFDLGNNFSIKVIEKFGHSQVWTNFSLPREVEKDELDVFHFPASSVWIKKAKRTVVTLHDISPVLLPELQMASKKMILYFRFLFWLIKNKADIIITVSHNSREDLLKYLKLSKDKVRVIYPGVEPYFRILDSVKVDDIRQKFNIKKDFILFVGAFQKRKNLPRIIRAYEKFVNESNLDYDFVIVGWSKRAVGCSFYTSEELLKILKLKDKIHFVGQVSDNDLVSLYNAARLFLFATFYEAFGFPLLEAMACGTPVITSNNSSGPEIVGDAGILVNPYNTDEIAEAMIDVLTDKKLYDSLVEKGLERAREFSWENTACQTLKVYKKLW
jgi:glycosyltransferase involved in cell wall biosynthesis